MLDADITVRRGGFAFRARFTAPRGVTVVFGPSGAGKSTLLSTLAGLVPVETGRIVLDGRVLNDASTQISAHERDVGVVFQDARLFPHLSVRGNLEFARRRAPDGAPQIEDVAVEFDIANLLERAVRNLSGGERSRVALARALLSAPKLLLLDEPFAALDGQRRQAFVRSLLDLHRRRDLPMMVVTHSIDDAAALGDYMIALNEGQVVAEGAVAEVAATPAFQSILDRRDIGAALPVEAVVRGEAAHGARCWVRADHVLLANTAPTGLSARNIWPGRVDGVTEEAGEAMLVRVATTFGPVFARLSRAAVAELGLGVGAETWVIVKAHAV